MRRLLNRWIKRKAGQDEQEEYPRSMLDLRAHDPCWCGSGRPYKKCCRSADRKRAKDLDLGTRKGSACDAFT